MVDNNLNKFGARSDAGPKCLSISAVGLARSVAMLEF